MQLLNSKKLSIFLLTWGIPGMPVPSGVIEAALT